MTLANDSILVTPGSGATFATHLVSGKEHEVPMLAGLSGHLDGSEPLYYFTTEPITHSVTLSQDLFDFYNGGAAGTVVRIRSIVYTILIEAALTGLGIRMRLLIGNGQAPSGGTSLVLRNLDTGDPAADAGIIAMVRPSSVSLGLATGWWWNRHIEETTSHASHPLYQEALPPIFWKKGLVRRVDESFQILFETSTNIGVSQFTVFLSID